MGQVNRQYLKRSVSYEKAKTWVCDQVPDTGVLKNTRSEAIAWYKQLLGVKRLPEGFIVREHVK